ncbi:MAG TPA: hypothetical protein VKS60_25765 [Stellaceae bacterium]|nr:hypothetical protein [Stellaceae bacterium]
MADELGIDSIRCLDDVVPVLFQHTVYKSYPVSLLEKYRFGALTKWLNRLSTIDLSKIDVSDCDSIDAWMDRICGETELLLTHSSGTSGAMSFLPRSKREYEMFFQAMRMGMMHSLDPEGTQDLSQHFFHVIWPTFSKGRSGIFRSAEFFRRYIAGSDERFHAINEGMMSSDIVFLAGRLAAAKARGELDRIELDPRLRRRQPEFEETQRQAHIPIGTLVDMILSLKGERQLMSGTWAQQWKIAQEGLRRGERNVFAPGSIVVIGGGSKGQAVPDDWQEQVKEFTGVQRFHDTYGMTEVTSPAFLCSAQHYHIVPWVLLYVLDPDDGTPYPREGVHTGRAAFCDLLAGTYWGGFISGDEVTVDWLPCPCGQTTARIRRAVQRFSEKRGGDDKISCAASEEAHNNALTFLTDELH